MVGRRRVLNAADAPWPAPAKVNRFLHIVGRRADGYHRLQTAFQFLDRADELWFEPTADDAVTLVDPLPGICSERDLCVRAATLLRGHARADAGVRIRRRKRLPVGGGLGGGSSDAATTLVALNHLWNLDLGVDELARLGLRLGADVPVFVRGRAAWAEGVGDRLTPRRFDRPWLAVLVPPVQVSTAEVFSDPGLTRDSRPLRGDRLGSEPDWETLRNDCETTVFRRYPQVATAARLLDLHAGDGAAWRARLTGTGGCLFAGFDDRRDAERTLAAALRDGENGLSGFVSRALNDSVLQDRLQQATIARGFADDGP